MLQEMAPGKRPSRMRGDKSKLPQQGFEIEEKEDNMPAEAKDAEKPAAIKHKVIGCFI